MAKCNSLSIDVSGLFMAIQNECYVQLNDVADKIIEGFRLFIVSDGAGRVQWRENAASEFKILSEKMAEDIMEFQVGIRDTIENESWGSFYIAQIMVALYGNHGPLYTKPGEITFHDHMESFAESHAQSEYALPDGFNWPDPHPEKMLENVMKITKQYFKDGVKSLFRNINFYNYVHVTAGG